MFFLLSIVSPGVLDTCSFETIVLYILLVLGDKPFNTVSSMINSLSINFVKSLPNKFKIFNKKLISSCKFVNTKL